MTAQPDLQTYAAAAEAWLAGNATPRQEAAGAGPEKAWGDGTDDVSMFHDLTDDEERARSSTGRWRGSVRKFDAGYGAIDWPIELGGAGLTPEHRARVRGGRGPVRDARPPRDVQRHPATSSPRRCVAFGTPEQQRELIPRFLRTTELCCQLFSEPGAGSDLAGLSTRAVRDGDEWVVNGQKTWSSGARFSQWGELIARTDPTSPSTPARRRSSSPWTCRAITVVPIRQMSGGASFNEVFFDDVRMPDRYRLGAVGEGWKVALTTLGFERPPAAADRGDQARGRLVGAGARPRRAARRRPATRSPASSSPQLYALDRDPHATSPTAVWPRSRSSAGRPGPRRRSRKLLWTQWMTRRAT